MVLELHSHRLLLLLLSLQMNQVCMLDNTTALAQTRNEKKMTVSKLRQSIPTQDADSVSSATIEFWC